MPLRSTALAFITIALWSFLAFLGARVTHLPSIQVVGIALTVSGLLSAVKLRQWRIPVKTLLVGVAGIFGYHFLYFTAFRFAPVVEANLVNYLWPLLIVLLAPVYLPRHRLQAHHLLGALMGMSGAALIVTGGRFNLDLNHLAGYLCAAGAAFIWASYSLLTKRLPPFPTAAVGSFCLVSGLLSIGVVLLDRTAYIPPSPADWISLVLLGLGPLGAAFFTWDAALKRGDPRIIGSLAYLTPLTSTLILVFIGGRPFTWISAIALVLIVAGAVLGSIDMFTKRKVAMQPQTFTLLTLPVGPWPMNCYIVIDDRTGSCAVVDPGADPETILAVLHDRKVERILVTHGHFDHVGALAELRRLTGAPVYLHPADAAAFDLEADIPLAEGTLIPVGSQAIRPIHTPGHTPGMTSFDLGDGRILVGDTLFVGGPGRTQTPQDFSLTMQTLRDIVFRWPDETRFFPGHGESGVIGAERPAFESIVQRGWDPDLHGDVTWSRP